jgi:hypothetical protein
VAITSFDRRGELYPSTTMMELLSWPTCDREASIDQQNHNSCANGLAGADSGQRRLPLKGSRSATVLRGAGARWRCLQQEQLARCQIASMSAHTMVRDPVGQVIVRSWSCFQQLLVRFFVETGARRVGALALRLRDVRADRQQVRLREKGDTERGQPISKTLLDAVAAHASGREPSTMTTPSSGTGQPARRTSVVRSPDAG